MTRIIRLAAFVYAAIVLLAAIWAWYVSIRMLHSSQEHLMPSFLLAIVSAPTSLSLDLLFERLPVISSGLMPLVWLTICGGIQVVLFFMFCAYLVKPQREA